MSDDDDSLVGEVSDPVIPAVSAAVWRPLFAAADTVRAAQPWKILVDGDWFAMAHPGSDEVSLGSVLGYGRTGCGVQLYRPPEGVRFWNDTLKNGEPDYGQLRFHCRLLNVEFLAKGRLAAEDHRIRKLLGLPKLPNKGRPYPCFRCLLPEALPWFLEEDEARLLTMALHLAVRQAEYFVAMGGGEKVDYPKDDSGSVVIPTYRLKEGGDPNVMDDWRMSKEPMPQAPDEADLIEAAAEEGVIAELQDLPKNSETWQIGSLNLPVPTITEGRPRFSRVVLSVEARSIKVMGCKMESPSVNAGAHYRAAFVQAAISAQALPSIIHVTGPVAKKALSEIAALLDIEIAVRLTLDAWLSVANEVVRRVSNGLSQPGQRD